MGSEQDPSAAPLPGGRKTFWRSASWSSSRTLDLSKPDVGADKSSGNGAGRRFAGPPLTPRSQNSKARSCLPPLQPLSIARRSLDEWPKAGSDDVGEWPQPPTPGAKPSEGLKLDLSSLRSQGKKDQISCFDKECSKVADHIYLGGDFVARNREILRQNGITHVLNCVGFVCPEYFKSDLVYKTLWLQDSPAEDITSILYDVFDYFEDVREQGGRVFVHCCQGVSRSTSLVIAYLMWRKGQSFDDAFQFVKAARGSANPNVGFACQLLQCQKRVHAIPLSPNSVLRMYRMAPHSPYDPLHLVPKMLNEPTPLALDSRGAFIVHVFSSIYVWIGHGCDAVMEKDAKAAAFQVVRYERVPGPITMVEEGEEPLEFWEAFLSAPDASVKGKKEVVQLAFRSGVGKKKVDAYDVDFELFYKATTGGVVPPFASSGPGQETHLPARESNWSILRRKFITGTINGTLSRVFSDSALVRNVDSSGNRVQVLSAESSVSPPYLSPSSLSSDSSSSAKCCSESPSISPISSSPSLTLSPASSNLPDKLVPPSKPSRQLLSCQETSNPCLDAACSPSKGVVRSIAERRGSFSLLKLPSLSKDTSLTSRKSINLSPTESAQEVVERSSDNHSSKCDALGSAASVRQVSDIECEGESPVNSSQSYVGSHKYHHSQDDRVSSNLSVLVDDTLVYRWPSMEKLTTFCQEDLDSKEAFLVLTPCTGRGGEPCRMLYLWIGSSFELANWKNQPKSCKDLEIDCSSICTDFIALMGLPKDLPHKVVKEQEAEELLKLFNST